MDELLVAANENFMISFGGCTRGREVEVGGGAVPLTRDIRVEEEVLVLRGSIVEWLAVEILERKTEWLELAQNRQLADPDRHWRR